MKIHTYMKALNITFNKTIGKTFSKTLVLTVLCGFFFSTQAGALGNQFEPIKPKDWEYKALAHFAQTGAIDTKGLTFSGVEYTLYELVPLMAEVAEKRYSLRGHDRTTADKLYTYYREEIDEYVMTHKKDDKTDKKPLFSMGKEDKTVQEHASQSDDKLTVGGEVEVSVDNEERKKGSMKTSLSLSYGVN